MATSREPETVDLESTARKARASDVHHIDVAIFKKAQGDADVEPEGQRVLCGCESYLAYTLKNGCALRFLERTHNRRGILKAHKNPIHMVRFVNYRSNVGASAAEKELFVWVITDDNAANDGADTPASAPGSDRLTVKLYFKLEDSVTVYNFTFFINVSVGVPDMLLLYDRKAAILESSKLIRQFDGPTMASLASDSHELRELNRPAGKETLCCNKVGDWFAFTTEPSLVVACTLRNRSTPAWAACEGDVVRSLELLETRASEGATLLIAATNTTVFQWSLTGDAEPSLLRRFVLGTAPIVTVLGSRNTFAIFTSDHRVALVESESPGTHYEATLYEMETLVCPPGVHFNRAPSSGFALVSSAKKIEMYQFVIDGGDASRSGRTSAAGTPIATAPPPATTTTTTPAPADNNTAAAETQTTATAPVEQTSGVKGAQPAAQTTKSTITTTTTVTQPSPASPNSLIADPAILSAAAATSSASPTTQVSAMMAAAVAKRTASPLSQQHPPPATQPQSLRSPAKRPPSRVASPNVTVTGPTNALSGLIQQLERGTLRPMPQPLSSPPPDTVAPPRAVAEPERQEGKNGSANAAPPSNTTTTPATRVARQAAPATAPAATVTSNVLPPPPAAATSQPPPSAEPAAPSRVVLHNVALPQSMDGLLSSAATQGDESVRKELENLQTAMKNILQITELTPSQVVRDHEQLINLALEAQMTELQTALAVPTTSGAGRKENNSTVTTSNAAAEAAARNEEEAFNSFAIVKLIAPISKEIVSGVTRGIRETLSTELDNALRTALGSSVRDSQKALIKRRLDEALAESSAFFTSTLTMRLNDFISRELAEALDRFTVLLQQSDEQNRQLRTALERLMDSDGVLQELQRLRQELATLKESVESGSLGHGGAAVGANPSSFQPGRPTPETILSTATHLIEQGRVADGLFYIAEAEQPSLTLQLVRKLTGDTFAHIITDTSVQDAVWSKIFTQLCRKDVVESNEDVLQVVELMFDVLSEREALTTAKTARAQQLMSDIRHFIARIKATNPSGEVLHGLRDLEKSLL